MKVYEYISHEGRIPYLDDVVEHEATMSFSIFGNLLYELEDGRTVPGNAIGKVMVEKGRYRLFSGGDFELEAMRRMAEEWRKRHGNF